MLCGRRGGVWGERDDGTSITYCSNNAKGGYIQQTGKFYTEHRKNERMAQGQEENNRAINTGDADDDDDDEVVICTVSLSLPGCSSSGGG